MKYDVTIGMPVFRSEAYIRQALCSALAQTYPSVEFLVVDDGSDDGSMAVVRDLQQQHPRGADIRILTHTANQGVAAARNHIIEAAQGDYLYFMDSDDQIAAETIALDEEEDEEEESDDASASDDEYSSSDGADEEEAVKGLVDLVDSGFAEEAR